MIIFTPVNSNYSSELGEVFSLDYDVSSLLKGNIPLKNINTDKLSLSEDNINSSNIILSLKGDLPKYFTFQTIKVGNSYSSTDRTLTIPASLIKNGTISVDLTFAKNVKLFVVSF